MYSCLRLYFFLDNIMGLAVDGETLIVYNETDPFPIKFVGLSSGISKEHARFYFNCKSNQSVSIFNQFPRNPTISYFLYFLFYVKLFLGIGH